MPISNTLDSSPLYTGTSVRGVVTASSTTDPMTVLKVINKIHSVFPAAGMTETAHRLYAVGTSIFPLGFPYVDPGGTPTGAATCGRTWLAVGGTPFSAYNPYTQTAGSDERCVMFPWGTSPIDSLTNLATAVTANTQLDAVATDTGGVLYLSYIAKGYGPAYNFIPVSPDGQFGFGGTPDLGGYEFLTSTNTAQATQYKIRVYGVNGGGSGGRYDPYDGRLAFEFVFGTNTKAYNLDVKDVGSPYTQYIILANSYGFTIFDPANDSHFLCNSSLFAQAPRITEFPDCTSLVVIAAPGSFRDTNASWQPCTVYQNGALTTFSDSPSPQVLALRSPGPTALLTLANTPVVTGTYLFLGGNSGATRQVLGKLWDCTMISDYINQATLINNLPHERVSAQTGTTSSHTDSAGATYNTRASVLWRYDTDA